jgi:hypothetical protein
VAKLIHDAAVSSRRLPVRRAATATPRMAAI